MSLASEQRALIRLVHVTDLIPTFTDLETPTQALRVQGALREIGQKVLTDGRALIEQSGIQADTLLHVIETPSVHVYDAIEEEAIRWPADLIVIGTHGRRGIRRFILGSVAEGAIRVATKPVLLVRAP